MPLESHLLHPSGQAEAKAGGKALSGNVVEVGFLMWLPGSSDEPMVASDPWLHPGTGTISLCSPVGLSPASIALNLFNTQCILFYVNLYL